MINTFEDDLLYESKLEVTNGAPWSFSKCWDCVVQQYGTPIFQYCINILYAVYTYCTPMNMALFFVKSVPTGVYVYNFVKSIYVTSRERMKLKKIELEELQLQIQIVNTKLSVRDAEFTDRALELERGTERLRRVRARVREVIAADDELKRSLHETALWDDDSETHINYPPAEREFIVQLLKEVKYEQGVGAERLPEMNCGEQSPAPDESVYSSASDGDIKQNCRIRIVKVTNVYKVNYLKHIKQIRQRRARKHAMLKKKMETVKKLLDEWQQTLNMVINSKFSILNMDSYVDLASQEAMGDYTKQDFRDLSDSNCDLRNMDNYEQPSLSWIQNTCTNLEGSFEDVPDAADTKEHIKCYTVQNFNKFNQSECSPRKMDGLFVLPEETVSQVAIEEIRSECSDEFESRDMISF